MVSQERDSWKWRLRGRNGAENNLVSHDLSQETRLLLLIGVKFRFDFSALSFFALRDIGFVFQSQRLNRRVKVWIAVQRGAVATNDIRQVRNIDCLAVLFGS
jgi:hypothetical protein